MEYVQHLIHDMSCTLQFSVVDQIFRSGCFDERKWVDVVVPLLKSVEFISYFLKNAELSHEAIRLILLGGVSTE